MDNRIIYFMSILSVTLCFFAVEPINSNTLTSLIAGFFIGANALAFVADTALSKK